MPGHLQASHHVGHRQQREDTRVTPFDAFIRRTSLDGLPQFINVLQGRMSIAGPRPHAVAHNEQYRGETDTLDKMIGRMQYDIDYLRNWSLTMDLRIITKTAKLTSSDRNTYGSGRMPIHHSGQN